MLKITLAFTEIQVYTIRYDRRISVMSDHTIVVTELIVRTTTLVVIECADVEQAMVSVKYHLSLGCDGLGWFKHTRTEERAWERIEEKPQ